MSYRYEVHGRTYFATPANNTPQWYGGVEQYCSNWHNSCVLGFVDVSIRKFLSVIGVDGSHGLRQLHQANINVRTELQVYLSANFGQQISAQIA